MLGALLALTLPLSAAPIVFTAIALSALPSRCTSSRATTRQSAIALLASARLHRKPYMLFTAFERTAYGELLAAVWIPLLLRAALRRAPDASPRSPLPSHCCGSPTLPPP